VESSQSSDWSGGLQPFDQMGAYRLLDRLGRGGMAEVFLAHAVLGDGIEKLVALKMALPEFGPDTEFGALFLIEARVSVTLEHPNLVHVFDAGEFAGGPTWPWSSCPAGRVAQLLGALRGRPQPPPPGLAVAVGVELCKALEYVHDKRDWDGRPLGLVHRDVSGANVLVTELGEVKLLDFGAAAANSFAESERLLVGKPSYMAPEQLLGARPSPSWDVFSLGVVLHEMLTLELRHGRVGPPDPPSQRVQGIDPALDRLVREATSPDPARRPRPRELRLCLQEARGRLPYCDLAMLGNELFGQRMVTQRAKIERLVAEARRRLRPRRHSRPRLKRLRSLRRRLLSTRAWIWMAGHRAAMRGIAVAALLAALGVGLLAAHAWQVEAAYRKRLAEADRQVQAGRLAGPGGDSALDLLLSAHELRPGGEEARRRLRLLADAFEDLASLAERRAAPAEAAVHLQAALRADPSRSRLRPRLSDWRPRSAPTGEGCHEERLLAGPGDRRRSRRRRRRRRVLALAGPGPCGRQRQACPRGRARAHRRGGRHLQRGRGAGRRGAPPAPGRQRGRLRGPGAPLPRDLPRALPASPHAPSPDGAGGGLEGGGARLARRARAPAADRAVPAAGGGRARDAADAALRRLLVRAGGGGPRQGRAAPLLIRPDVREAEVVARDRHGRLSRRRVPVQAPDYPRLVAVAVPHAVRADGRSRVRVEVLYDDPGVRSAQDVQVAASMGELSLVGARPAA
jgi:hypothetical protein